MVRFNPGVCRRSIKSLAVAGLACVLLVAAHAQDSKAVLRVCADPGNMPLSSAKGEGFQNKIIETLARAMDTKVTYFWRPYLERGLTRETFANDECVGRRFCWWHCR